MPPKRKVGEVQSDAPRAFGPAATAGPIPHCKGEGKGTYHVGPKQEFGSGSGRSSDSKAPPMKKAKVGCGICGEKSVGMELATKCLKCSKTHQTTFPFWDWDTLCSQYHENDKVKR
eukprot:2077403-Pyramimonas_sp.AAC.1